MDIIGVIDKVEDDSYDGKEFKKVTLKDGQVLKVKQGREGSLKAKWDLLQWGVAIKFTMAQYLGKDFVKDIASVEGALPPPAEPKILPEHQEAIDKSRQEVRKEIAPQAIGMMTKEIGDMIRAKYLVPIFGKDVGNELIKWYRGQALGITQIPFDGKDLPTFE